MNPTLVAVFFATCFGTFFQFGYHNGVINQPLELISQFISNVTKERFGSNDGVPLTMLTSLCVTTYLIGGLFGGLIGGVLSNKFGRRLSIIMLSVPCLTGCALLVTCKLARSFEMIIVGRLLVGLACGAYTAIGPAYLTEVAPPAIRGAAGAVNQLMAVFALVLSQVLGLKQVMNTEKLWPLLLGLNAIPCILSVIYLFFAPESPRYLYLVRNDENSARAALLRLGRSVEELQFELDGMLKEAQTSSQKISLCTFFRVHHLRWALMIALVCQVGQQFSGINGLLYYSGALFKSNGLTSDQAIYATIGIGAVLFLTTLVSTFVIDRLGRRVLFIGGLFVAFLSLIIFTMCLVIRDSFGVHWPFYGAILTTYLFVIGFGVGPGAIPWFIVAEMFTQETRDVAISVAVVTNWLCNIVVGLVFLQLLKYIGIYSFLPFIVILLMVILFLYFYLPETKDRSATTIQAQLLRRIPGYQPTQYQVVSQDFASSVTEADEP